MAHTHGSGIIAARSAVFRYGVAALAVAAATAVRLALEPVLGVYSPYLPFALAVIVASRFGGRGPGLAATALSLVAVPYFFLEPRYVLWVSEPHAVPGLVLFGAIGTIISFLVGQLRQSLLSTAAKNSRLEELSTALEMAHAMVRTPDGLITYWSPGAVAMYGWPPEEAIGRRSHELLKTEFPEPLERIRDRLMERGYWEGELHHHRRDGSMVVAASHWSLQRDEQGRPSAVVEVNNDITALRQAEKALGESEGQFRTLANAIPQLCWMANADGWIFWYNHRWYEYTGTTPEQMEGWGWQSVHDPEELPKVLERWKVSIATGEPFDMVFPLRGADGVFRPFLTRVMPVRDSSGKVVHWFGTNTDISEQRKTEQALRESEERFRSVAENMSEGLMVFDAQGNFTYQNPASLRIHGFGIPNAGHVEDDNLPAIWKAWDDTGRALSFEEWPLSRVLRGERFQDQVLRAMRVETGQEFYASYNGCPIVGADGRLIFGFITIREITEQRKAEMALRDSEERLRLAQQVARVGTFEWNIQTGVNHWTPELEAIYGLPPGGFAGTQRAWEELVHPADRPEAVRRVRQAMETGSFEAEWRVIQPGGAERWLFGRGSVFQDDAGKPLRLIGVNIDVTERKQAEEALQQQTALVNFSHDAIIVADANRVITSWNTGAEEIYGWNEAEAVGNEMHQLFQTGSPVLIADIDRTLAQKGRWDGELVHTRRDGKHVIVESRQILRRDAAGAPIGILEIDRDITERKRLEDQFRQAQKLEGIGRLAGGVAHDFNNLLTVISGFAQMVLDDLAVQHPMRGPMEEISKAAARATSLTRQLLIFSRRQVIEPKNIVLNDLVREFEKMLRRLIGEDIRLVLSLDPGAGFIRADPGQIEQVILNLAVNARDAMPKGGTLTIETSSLLVDEEFAQKHLSVQPGLYVVLMVSDTGVGMSPEVKSRLFEPFFTTKEAGKGTGLGLSTVYGIVKQSEGSVWVYSEPGRGTTFRMLFPAVEAEGELAPPAPVEVSSGNETILLAEDEPGVRGFVRQTLERHGYTVLETSNGREALELARKHTGPIHLLMADVVMPEMDGAELADQFGADRPGVPVLFMSGYADHLGRSERMGAGYLQKPFTSASLLTQVRAVLDAV